MIGSGILCSMIFITRKTNQKLHILSSIYGRDGCSLWKKIMREPEK